jgi:hypothetical protein
LLRACSGPSFAPFEEFSDCVDFLMDVAASMGWAGAEYGMKLRDIDGLQWGICPPGTTTWDTDHFNAQLPRFMKSYWGDGQRLGRLPGMSARDAATEMLRYTFPRCAASTAS